MKAYVKPTIEVISMRTSENIADNNIIKTIYTKTEVGGTYNQNLEGGTYSSTTDIVGSNPANA